MPVRADNNLQLLATDDGTIGTTHNANLDGRAFERCTGGSVATFTGVQPQKNGRLMAWTASSGSAVTTTEDGASSAANRFVTGFTCGNARRAMLTWYDPLSTRWRSLL